MKKIYIYIIAFIFASCSQDFLNKYPEDLSTSSSFYRTEAQFTQAINGAYSTLRGLYGSETKLYVMLEMRSDNTHYTRYNADRGDHILYRENIADFIVIPQNSKIADVWKKLYEGVARTNVVLDRIGQADLPADFKKNIEGQARFLRAFYYFHLVRLYGGVPLQLSEITDAENAFKPRASVDAVYTAIITDVDAATKLLPNVKFNDKGFAMGYATAGAARMLYAEVLMTKRDFAAAEIQLKELFKMGYDLEINYADVFDPANKNGVESIFEVQYLSGDVGLQNDVIYDFLPKGQNTSVATNISDKGDNILRGGWNVPTQALIDLYEPGDKRLNASIAFVVGTPDANNALVYEKIIGAKETPEAGKIARPFIKKFLHTQLKEFNNNDNWTVYRFADALLLMSECLVEQGRASEAKPHLDRVRARAGLLTVTPTADAISKERRLELAFENHRWYDLLRTGKAVQVMTEYGKYIKQVDPFIPPGSYNIKADYLIYPIPYREMYTNTALQQNPGYN